MEEELENYMVLITKMDAQLAELPGTRNFETLKIKIKNFLYSSEHVKEILSNILNCAYDI